jgi:RHH-type proline utilization regulon transcriptional repressor/proline dehydrogenase/delta 1-pyrroline-5-carboxylate dehydrogenase
MDDRSHALTDIASLEPAIRRIGQALAAKSEGLSPSLFDSRWWSGSLLDWCMNNEPFKVQLFRFVDVLPALGTDDQVAKLAEEYFAGLKEGGPLQWGLQVASWTKLGARLSAKALRKRITQMARIFIAGSSIEEALPVLADSWKEGRAFSVDLLGEATVSEKEADQYRDRCLHALKVLGEATRAWPPHPRLEQDHLGPVPRINLSVKLSALYSQLDPIDQEGSYAAVAARLRPILDVAVTLPAGITFDMEQAELKDLTLTIFKRLLKEDPYRRYPYAGIALQAYLRESAQDLQDMIQWIKGRGAPIAVRLVKGAYWDSDVIRYEQRGWPVPVFRRKAETDANYEAMTNLLLAHADVLRPCIATHNLRSLAHAQAAAEAMGLPPQACEYQMIFGMAEPLQQAVVAEGRRLRLYTPVGEFIPGMAYLVRRLLENTSNESFLRKEYAEAASLDSLLAPPLSPAPAAAQPAGATREADGELSFVNEPPTDFSRTEATTALSQALARVREQIGGTLVPPAGTGRFLSGAELIARNPFKPDEVIGRMRGASADDVPQAVRLAQEQLPAWRALAPVARAEILLRAAEAMRQRRMELSAWEILETGKPWREADADVAEAIDFLTFYADRMTRLAEPRRLGHLPGELNHESYAPRGVAAVIAPWNFPLAIPTGMVSAALVTGNTVLFKPSERSLAVGRLLVETLMEAGLPPGVLQFLPGGPAVGRVLTAAPDIQMIAFTGSKEVGLGILAAAAKLEPGQRHVKHVVAEMGGKNAVIVDDTADLDEAVTGVVASFTGYQGQKCSACSRAIVLDAVYEPFLQRLADAVQSLKIGNPEDPGTKMGPMIDERARTQVQDYVAIGRREGRLVLERQVSGSGWLAGPAIFADIASSARLAQEEIFGPVLAVLRAHTFAEALAMANDSAYALTGGLYSRSPVNIQAARASFDVGNLYINRPITGALVSRQPFGGHRLSGVGTKAGGEDYLKQFMVARVVSENTLRRGFAPHD